MQDLGGELKKRPLLSPKSQVAEVVIRRKSQFQRIVCFLYLLNDDQEIRLCCCKCGK